MSTVINELSLTPNLGLGGTTGTTGTMGTMGTGSGINAPGSKNQKILKTTAALTKQINDLTNKIVAAKQKAASASGTEQQSLVNTVGLLQQQLQALMNPEQEESEETIKQKIAKKHKAAGKHTSKFIGLESKNNLNKNINNNANTMKKKNKKKNVKLEEGILGRTATGAAKGALGGAATGALIGALGGPIGVLGGAATGAAAGAGVGAASREEEENADQLTPIQDKVVNALAKRKYYVNRVSYQFAEEEGGPTVFMTMKPNHYTSRYAEVSPDGLVNGETLKDFLGGRDENEEKMLSKKQQRIAKLAGDPNKIDGADFAKLRAMKSDDEESCMGESTKHETCQAAEKGCKCNKCKDCRANQKKNVKESKEIPTFLRAILQKNYAQADKYLGSVLNGKIKGLINKALDTTNL